MSEVIMKALIDLVGLIISGLIGVYIAKNKVKEELTNAITVIKSEISNIKSDIARLDKKQDKHNNLMERMFKLEERVENLKK